MNSDQAQEPNLMFDLDRHWFANNPNRKFRLRLMSPGEGFKASHVFALRFGKDGEMWIGISPVAVPDGSLDDLTDEQIAEIFQAMGQKWAELWLNLLKLSQLRASVASD